MPSDKLDRTGLKLGITTFDLADIYGGMYRLTAEEERLFQRLLTRIFRIYLRRAFRQGSCTQARVEREDANVSGFGEKMVGYW